MNKTYTETQWSDIKKTTDKNKNDNQKNWGPNEKTGETMGAD